jgi:hypothetical protein
MSSTLAFGVHDDNLISISNMEYYEKIELNLKGGNCRTLEKWGNILGMNLVTKNHKK